MTKSPPHKKTGLTIHQFDSDKTAVIAAAQELVSSLIQNATKKKERLLLLAGGSAVKIYKQATILLQKSAPEKCFAGTLSIALGDDRWPMLNNAEDVFHSGFIQTCTTLGADFYPLRTDTTAENAAKDFAAWVERKLVGDRAQLTMVIGIGADGHTLGVNTSENEGEFSALFLGKAHAVSYTSTSQTAAFPQYPNRITASLSLLQRANNCLGVILGSDKKHVLTKLMSQPTLQLHEFPAAALHQTKTTLFAHIQ